MDLIAISVTMSRVERIINDLLRFVFIKLDFKDLLNRLSKALEVVVNESLFVEIVFP